MTTINGCFCLFTSVAIKCIFSYVAVKLMGGVEVMKTRFNDYVNMLKSKKEKVKVKDNKEERRFPANHRKKTKGSQDTTLQRLKVFNNSSYLEK